METVTASESLRLNQFLTMDTTKVSEALDFYINPWWWRYKHVGFEVLTAVVMKISIFWNITSCSPSKANRRLGRTCRLHLQGGRIRRSRTQRESRWQAETVSETQGLFISPWILTQWRFPKPHFEPCLPSLLYIVLRNFMYPPSCITCTFPPLFLFPGFLSTHSFSRAGCTARQ
jgi:hypothetical protein